MTLPLNPLKLQAALNDVQVIVLESTASTNDYLKNLSTKHPVLCLAEHQSAGKGRLGRNWFSPTAENIYLSYAFYFQEPSQKLSGLSLVFGLAIRHAIHSHLKIQSLKLKWPNDILWENKKIAGILIETHPVSAGVMQVVVGVGINVNMMHDDGSIAETWGSLKKITGVEIDRNELVITLMQQIQVYLTQFFNTGLKTFLDEWQSGDILFQKNIVLKNGETAIQGKMLGVNSDGCLLLKLENGETKMVAAGEATILKNHQNH